MENIEEFKELIRRYETISTEEIHEAWKSSEYKNGHCVAQKLTGFGGSGHCTLCIAVNEQCGDCVLSMNSTDMGFHCLNEQNRPTYKAIDDAETPEDLHQAYKNRAKHYRKFYKEIL